jgi:hypothetical protein
MLVLLILVPAVARAQPAPEQQDSSRLPELGVGTSLLAGGYLGSLAWAAESAGDQDGLYVPVLGPWLELFGLPDCEARDVFCEHGNATRGVLIVDGVAQAVGLGLTLHALLKHEPEKPLRIVPSFTGGNPGFAVRGRF